MPNYRTHTKINLLLVLPVLTTIGILLAFTENTYLWTFAISFLYGTLFMSPDLDYANKINSWSLRGFLSIPFLSYAKIFRHRGLSHSILFGTMTRILWLAGHALLFLFLFYHIKPTPQALLSYLSSFQMYFIYGFSGLFLSDATHIIVDKFA